MRYKIDSDFINRNEWCEVKIIILRLVETSLNARRRWEGYLLNQK